MLQGASLPIIASLPINAILRPRDTQIWKLEAALKCRVMPEGPVRSAHAHDKADRAAEDHAEQRVHASEDR